jgi:carbon starvation protein
MIFNDRLDAAVAAFFMAAVVVILIESARSWVSILSGRVTASSTEVSVSHRRDFAIDATSP